MKTSCNIRTELLRNFLYVTASEVYYMLRPVVHIILHITCPALTTSALTTSASPAQHSPHQHSPPAHHLPSTHLPITIYAATEYTVNVD